MTTSVFHATGHFSRPCNRVCCSGHCKNPKI